MQFQNYLTEKQIIVGGGKKYGQIVFLAGGAGSGKGFAASNFMESSKFKIRDVDELKKAVAKLMKLKGEHPEIANTDWGNPKDVFRIHQFVKDMKLKEYTLELLLAGASKGQLPNIMFDVTLKDMGDVYEVMPQLLEVGYKPIDVHLTWVLTDFYVAVQQNSTRERRVPYEILLKTHVGAANTVTDMLRKKDFAIGTVINGAVNIVLGGNKNTILMTTGDTRDTLKGQNKNIQQPGEPIVRKGKYSKKDELVIKSFKYINVKEEGKPMKRSSDFENELINWADLRKFIKDNIPKTTDTRNIRRRKRV